MSAFENKYYRLGQSMKKQILLVIIIVLMSVSGCGQKKDNSVIEGQSFDELVEMARGTTVTFYGWGGDENINRWLDQEIANELKSKYDITLERVPMVPPEYIPKLINEKQVQGQGTIDVVWINGENFYTAKQADLLYGPFTDTLPNYLTYLDGDSPDNLYDFGQPIDGYEAPYGRAQMTLIADQALVEVLPASHEALMALAVEHPGQITYPDVSDFTGSAFVRNIIYDIVGYEVFLDIDTDKEAVRTVIEPALTYLKELKPYLWLEGTNYPASVAQLDNMFSDGEVLMTMNYTPFHVATKIEEGAFSKTATSFVFDRGSIGNTHFLAVPFNAPNKAAAMVLINHMMNPEVQASKLDPAVWGDLPVTAPDRLTKDQKIIFDSIELGQGVLPQEELLTKRVPEMKAALVPIINELWREEVMNEKE